ncbi:MAG TPA: hypothetical protein PL029_12615 [Bacteroidia bacterium]|nr:hypothetical protein [Bacteroidia bacterium]
MLCSSAIAQKIMLFGKQDARPHLELMVVPALFYNSVSVGVSKNTSQNIEQALTLSAFAIFIDGPVFQSAALRYNYNIVITGGKKVSTYVPVWVGTRYLYNFGSKETEDIPPSQNLFYSFGSGYGVKFTFKNQHKLRCETGLGFSMNTVSNYLTKRAGTNSFVLDTKSPVVPSLRLSIKYLIPL